MRFRLSEQEHQDYLQIARMRSGRGRDIGLRTQGDTPRGGFSNELIGAQFELAVGILLSQPVGGVHGYESVRRDFVLPDGRPVWAKSTYPQYRHLIIQPRDELHLRPGIMIIAGRKVSDLDVEFFGSVSSEEFRARHRRRTLGTITGAMSMLGAELNPLWLLMHEHNVPHPGLERTNPELYGLWEG